MNSFYRQLIEEQHLAHCAEIDAIKKSFSQELRYREGKLITAQAEQRKKFDRLASSQQEAVNRIPLQPFNQNDFTMLLNEIAKLRLENAAFRIKNQDQETTTVFVEEMKRELLTKEKILRNSHLEHQQHLQTIAQLHEKVSELQQIINKQQNEMYLMQSKIQEFMRSRNTLFSHKHVNPLDSNLLKVSSDESKVHKILEDEKAALIDFRASVQYSELQEEVKSLRQRLKQAQDILKEEREQLAHSKSFFEHLKKGKKSELNERVAKTIRALSKSHDNKVCVLFFSFWRLRASKIQKLRFKKETNQAICPKIFGGTEDGITQIFKDFRNILLSVIYQVFILAVDGTVKKKCTSLQLFRSEFEILVDQNRFSKTIAKFFFHLKSQVKNRLPHLKDISYKLEPRKEFSNSYSSFLCELEEVKTESPREWLISMIEKTKKGSKKSKSSEEVFTLVFQLLSIWHRANNPMRKDISFMLNNGFMEVLSTKIVSASMRYITLQVRKG